jgi:hypothetical protein
MARLERMAAEPGLSQRPYLDLLREMRLLSAELAAPGSDDPPPAVPLVETEEWIELRELWFDFLKEVDPSHGLKDRWMAYLKLDQGEG